MNPLVYTKAITTVQNGIARRYSCQRLWHHTNYSYGCRVLVASKEPTMITTRKKVNMEFYNIGGPPNISVSEIRCYHMTPSWRGQESSSKVEETVKTIKEQKKEEKEKIGASSKDVVQASEKSVAEKRTILQKIKSELLHYYHGFRLLGLDMKISAKLIWRILQGKELSRREHRLLVKTTGDMFRLIPFSVFIIVPFMELLLPVFIKLFPGMLPSTFQTATEKEDKLKQALKVKIEVAKFLQKTLDDMAVQSSDHYSEKAKEFTEFFYKVRTTGTSPTTDEIMKFSKLFEDEITLDSLSRQQLIALCRVLDVQTFGTTNFLRFLLRMKFRSLAADDRLIEKEGVETLTRSELQQACRARGMRAYGLPDSKLREQLAQWLDLSLDKKVPPSLLLLSRALMVPETIPMTDKLKATISALPDAVVARTQGAICDKEGKVDHRTNIEIIKMEEQRIEEERQEQTKHIEPQPTVLTRDDKKDEITTTDVKVLEQALDSIGKDTKRMTVEKEVLKELKEEMAEYQEDIQELYQMKAEAVGKDDIADIKVSKGAKRLFVKVNKMINKMDAVLEELEQSEKQVKRKIEALPPEEKEDAKVVEELVKIDELIAAIKKIQSVPDENRLQKISEILGKIDDDRDGAIKVEDVLKVIEMIGQDDVKLSKKQMEELIELMDKEEVLEVEDQIQKALEKESRESEKKLESKSSYSTVPATPVTKEKKREIKEDLTEVSKTYPPTSLPPTSAAVMEESRKSSAAAVLKSSKDKETVGDPPPMTPGGVPPTPKKAEGSKQL